MINDHVNAKPNHSAKKDAGLRDHCRLSDHRRARKDLRRGALLRFAGELGVDGFEA